MANIFSLFGTIFIDNEKANSNIDETTKKGEKAGSKVGSAFGSIAKGAVAMGTAVVGGATAVGSAAYKMAMSTSEQADYIDKLSERTGINREELQRWKHAADQSGVSIDSFKNGIKKMSDVVDDANRGSKTATTAISRLGLSLDDLNKMSTEEKFNAITAALADMEDGAERNAIGNDLLGKSYTEMLPLLNAGSDGMAALKKEADDLGLVMSEGTVKAGVKLGDTIANVKAAAGGMLNKIGAVAIPVVQKFADMIITATPIIQSVMIGLIPIITQVFDSALPPLFDLVQMLFPALISLIQMILPQVGNLLSAAMPLILEFLPILIELIGKIMPVAVNIIEAILPVLISLLEIIMPILKPILDILTVILEPLLELINIILPPLINILKTIIEHVLPPLQRAFSGVANIVSSVFKDAFGSVGGIAENVKRVLNGVNSFLTGVFTGNWKQAWEGVRNIFKGIINTIPAVAEKAINGVISVINGIIRGISWTVEWTGKKLPQIPKVNLPRYRIGLDYVPYDEFPALLHKGERVLTQSEAKTLDERRSGTVSGATAGNDDMLYYMQKLIAMLAEFFPAILKLMEALGDFDPDEFVRFFAPKFDERLGYITGLRERGV